MCLEPVREVGATGGCRWFGGQHESTNRAQCLSVRLFHHAHHKRRSPDPILPGVPHMFRKTLTAVAAASLLLAGCTSNNPDPTPTESPTETTSPDDGGSESPTPNTAPEDTRGVTVYVDGWSVATAGVNTIRWSMQNGPSGSAPLTKLTAEDVTALRTDLPDVVQRVAGRIITPIRNLRCTADSICEATGDGGTREFTDAQIADLDDVPLSEVYDAWDVDAGIYKATLNIPENAQQVDVSLADSDGFTVTLVAGGGRVANTTNPSVVEGPIYDPEALSPLGGELGYNQDTFLLSYAFGQLFYTEPSWLDLDRTPFLVDVPMYNADADSGPDAIEAPDFSGGLGAPVEGVQAMGPSVLTYRSSPTLGCNVAVFCAPTSDGNVERDVVSTDTGLVCRTQHTPEGGQDGEGLQTAVSAVVADWAITTDKPVHQAGWEPGGYDDTILSDPNAELDLFSGTDEKRVTEVAYFDDTPPQLWNFEANAERPDEPVVETVDDLREVAGVPATC